MPSLRAGCKVYAGCRVKASLWGKQWPTYPKWAHNYDDALLNQDGGLGDSPHKMVNGKREEGTLPEVAFDKILTYTFIGSVTDGRCEAQGETYEGSSAFREHSRQAKSRETQERFVPRLCSRKASLRRRHSDLADVPTVSRGGEQCHRTDGSISSATDLDEVRYGWRESREARRLLRFAGCYK